MIAGGTSTGSKHPRVLFGREDGVPTSMIRSAGCHVWDESGRRYLDWTMALGSVSLGYGHRAVVDAVQRAVADGGVGPLAPRLEAEVGDRIGAYVPGAESVRFLKTGAEAVSAAVRIARVVTGRERLVLCGYQGWLDQFSDAPGVPTSIRALATVVPFNDGAALQAAFDEASPAALVVEPVVDGAPSPEWVAAVNRLTESTSTPLIVDELKTGLRLDPCGSSRFGFRADLIVLGKALGNGLPLAAVAGSRDLMAAVERTWISSTLATEFVSLAAAGAVLDRYLDGDGARVRRNAERAWTRLAALADAVPSVTLTGIPEMAYLRFPDEAQSTRFAAACAARGLLFKRNAYNFPSLVHDDAVLEETVACLDSVLREVASW